MQVYGIYWKSLTPPLIHSLCALPDPLSPFSSLFPLPSSNLTGIKSCTLSFPGAVAPQTLRW